MIVKLPKTSENARMLMRRLGYSEHHYRGETEQNFTRRFGAARFPRVHVYVAEEENALTIKMHLDMQEQTAFGQRHGGVYEHELLEQEAARIKKILALEAAQSIQKSVQKPHISGRRSFWHTLFGRHE